MQIERRRRLEDDRYTTNGVYINSQTQNHRGSSWKGFVGIISTLLKQDTLSHA